MKADPEGAEILRDRPVVTSDTLDVAHLRSMPDGTFGREYQRHMDTLGISADTRKPVSVAPAFLARARALSLSLSLSFSLSLSLSFSLSRSLSFFSLSLSLRVCLWRCLCY